MNNIPVFSGLDLNGLFVMKAANRLIHTPDECEDVLFVNTAYDTQLADKYDIIEGKTEPYYRGKIAVADRQKLTELLKRLENVKYKCIILDIEFAADTKTECDSALYSQIGKMKNIVIGYDKNNPLDPRVMLDSKGVPDSSRIAMANYYATVTETNFVKYKYSENEKRYVPLSVYEAECPEDSIKQWGFSFLPIYTSGNSVCWNSVVLRFSDNPEVGTSNTIREQLVARKLNVVDLGNEILEKPNYNLEEEAYNKYVIIANLVEDMHDTYGGTQSGCFILYEAMKTLKAERHKLSPLYFIVWVLVYALIFLFVAGAFRISYLLSPSYANRHRFFAYLLDLIGVTSILYICQVVEFVITGTLSAILLPGFMFYVLQLYHDFKK